MNKQQAQNLIKETFECPFEKGRFIGFVKNLLNQIDDAPFIYQGNYIPDAYKPYISSLERIGKYTDGEHKIDILCVQLKKETSLERARTMQRNFIAWYLNGSRGGEMKDAALVAFVSPGEADWRFSLVKMDYRFEEGKNGKVKVREEFTPARRWSFLVGSNEASHTAQSRLVPILAEDERNPTLKQLEDAFDIETVSKEFFLKYRDLFIRTKEALDEIVAQASSLRHEFEAKGVDTVNFAKKLLGQIVFLYFLQKKGWFGVGRDAEWGMGSKKFLRELFDGKHSAHTNFFNDILEPLFYEALRIDRRHDDDYYSRFNCKIPFLNGGLFDPIGSYDWVHTDIIIPNELFSNTVRTKEGDIGNGILDIFDRYNFTVKEDEPLEKEVAIDPELLGKAYEKFNAIRPDNYEEYKAALKSGKKGAENKFNKKFGVYYTPREIVHYMCQQSLINYLYSVTQASSLSNQSTSITSSRNQASQPETKAKPDPEGHRQDACDTQHALDTIMYFDPDAPISKKQRNLPHWQQKGTAYFVTFRLFDSIPKEVAESIRKEREQWLKSNNISDPSELKNLSRSKRIEYYRLFSKRYDDLLDNGYGCCVLAKPECKKIVESALKYFDGERYDLDKNVVMPNHVHAIVLPKENWDLSKITHSWKSFTSNEINKILGRKGQLWMPESFDHIIRSPLQLEKIHQYIVDNPKKSKVAQSYSVTQASQPESEPSPTSHRQDACATISKEDIETLIKFGEQVSENEAAVLLKEQQIADGKQKTTKFTPKLPESIRQNAELIDQALANITVCDPAIGSGAFPVGMMHEIVKIRNLLSAFIEDPNRTIYSFKSQCIEKSLYGVDIDPGAVEIAKLRLWLSLVVDEEDIRRIKPLPNLDYKIVCGNSLLGVEKDLFNNQLFTELERLKPFYFNETNPTKKQEYKNQIDGLISEIVTQPSRLKERHRPHRQDVCDTVFDFEVYFSEVFHEKGGFDVVIGNPPYVQLQTDKGRLAMLYKNSGFHTFTSTGDIYCLFYEKANQLLKRAGVTCYITSNKWMRAAYGEKLRKYFTQQTQPLNLIDVGPGVFDAATVDTNILLFAKDRTKEPFLGCKLQKQIEWSLDEFVHKRSIRISLPKNGEKWQIDSPVQQRLTQKIETNGIPLKDWNIQIYFGVKTGYNEAFIIDGLKKEGLITTDPKSAEIIKPLLRGRDIQRYRANFADMWLIATFPSLSLDIDNYPAIKNYLKTFGKKLDQSGKKDCRKKTNHEWFETQDNIAFYKEFKKEKVVWKRIGSIMRFSYDDTGTYCLDSTCIATGEKIKFLVGVLNSSLCLYELFRSSPKTGTGDQIISVQALEPLRIPKPNSIQEEGITDLVDQILAYTQSSDYLENTQKQAKVQALEREIDQMVYQLYGLSEEEIAIVEE